MIPGPRWEILTCALNVILFVTVLNVFWMRQTDTSNMGHFGWLPGQIVVDKQLNMNAAMRRDVEALPCSVLHWNFSYSCLSIRGWRDIWTALRLACPLGGRPCQISFELINEQNKLRNIITKKDRSPFIINLFKWTNDVSEPSVSP